MSIQNEIERIRNAKEKLRRWLESKYIPVPEGASLNEMVDLLPEEGWI